jgi:hypothetical protein
MDQEFERTAPIIRRGGKTMNLIEVYIGEVTRRLPEKNREDIALELRSAIEDMLPEEYTEAEVKEVLADMGNPAVLASNYSERPMHLIGPKYYDIYISLIKMILPIAATIALISLVAEYVFSPTEGRAVMDIVLTIMGEGIWRIIEVGMQVFFWLTLTIVIIERADKGKDPAPLTTELKKWTPDDLEKITYIPKKRSISKYEVFGSLLWTAIWATVYFYANKLLGIYENNGDGLVFVTPSMNQEVLNAYWPAVIVIIGFEIALALYKLLKKQWTKRLAIFNTIYEIIATVVFIVIVTNPNVFQPEFVTYMANLFGVSTDQFVSRIVWGSSAIFLFFAGLNSFEGFRKSRAR